MVRVRWTYRFFFFLDTARAYANIPFIVNSGYRCSKHDSDLQLRKAVKDRTKQSSHKKGLAVDLATNADGIPNSLIAYKIMEWCRSVGFTRFFLYKNHIHVDYDTDKTPNVLGYGEY